VWKYEVVAPGQVPAEYLMTIVDVAKVAAAVEGGVRVIPGVRIYEHVMVVART
jgi:hypothetical protein